MADRSSYLDLYSSEAPADNSKRVRMQNLNAKVSWGAAQEVEFDFGAYKFVKADDSKFDLEDRFAAIEVQVSADSSVNGIGITNLQNAVASEAASRASGDTSNSNAIAAENTRATTAEGVVDAKADAEIVARGAADVTIAADVVAESAARAAAVTAEEQARAAAITSLGSQIASILANADAAAIDSLQEIVTSFQAVDASFTSSLSTLTGRVSEVEGVLNTALQQNLGP